MNNWQPIKTAPEDKLVLVYGVDRGVCIASFDRGFCYTLHGDDIDVTHWQPLPEPPESEEVAE